MVLDPDARKDDGGAGELKRLEVGRAGPESKEIPAELRITGEGGRG